MKLEVSRRNSMLLGIILVGAVIYALIALPNHYFFRTFCLDLGTYTKALYDYIHGHCCDSSIFLWEPQNLLSDHFDLYLIILSPLSLVFGQYTLIIVQIVALLFGGYGVYRLIGLHSESHTLPFIALICFLTGFGAIHAVSFDYHSNVVAAMFFPWMLYSLKREHYGWTFVFAVLLSLGKETMPLWLIFSAVALLWDYRSNKMAKKCLWEIIAFGIGYFILVSVVFMPAFGGQSKGFWRYEWMGENYREIAMYIASHPWETIQSLFTNCNVPDAGHGVKMEFLVCCMASGLLFMLKKPNYIIMLIPLWLQKMLSQDVGFWGVTNHYNIEIHTVLVIGAFTAISELRAQKLATALSCVALALTILTTFYTTSNPYTHIRKENVRIFDKRHFRQDDFDSEYVRELIEQIPSDASVCATTFFVPHLALRDSIYMFPVGLGYNAEYYLLKRRSYCYYEGEEDKIDEMISDTLQWETLKTNGDIYLLRRR